MENADDPERAFEKKMQTEDRLNAAETILLLLLQTVAREESIGVRLISDLRKMAAAERKMNRGDDYIWLLEARAAWLERIVARRRGVASS